MTGYEPWLQANQAYLAAEVAAVGACLERRAEGGPGADSGPRPRAPWPDGGGGDPPPPLEQLCETLGLSAFERDLLLMCAGMELDSRMPGWCADTSADPREGGCPTFALALAALPGAHWSALSPMAPLRWWRLIEVGRSERLVTARLRIDEWVLHFLTGLGYPDERLGALGDPLPWPDALPPSQAAVAEQALAVWRSDQGAEVPLGLWGPDPGGRRAVAAWIAARAGLVLRPVPGYALPASAVEQEAWVRLWSREALLNGGALLVECESLVPQDGGEPHPGVLGLLERGLPGVMLSGREPLPPLRTALARFEVRKPTAGEQQALWREALGPAAARLNGTIPLLCEHFDLGRQAIEEAALHGLAAETLASQAGEAVPGGNGRGRRRAGARGDRGHETAHEGGALAGELPGGASARIWEACRAQARPSLENLAQRIEPTAGWDDLILPEPQKEALREIAAQVRHRERVYREWGMGPAGSRGLGVTALFSGLSGTGKTMAAEVLAGALNLDLYRIDLSAVVSKYIGDTEKNLRRVFDAAEGSGCVLLFDEADALFGKRSEVKDSHDRYANIEVSYLLQRMEAYRGLAILTTNQKAGLDQAFMRRLRFVVEFPFPDYGERLEIWRQALPSGVPRRGVIPERLARLNVAGGNIRTIALNAAFRAAAAGEPVTMRHVRASAQGEYRKLEKTFTGLGPAGDEA